MNEKFGAKKSLYRSRGIAGNSACLKNSYTEVTSYLRDLEGSLRSYFLGIISILYSCISGGLSGDSVK